MSRATLTRGDRVLSECSGGFADPLPLLLYEEGDRDAVGLRIDSATARARLAEAGASDELAKTVTAALQTRPDLLGANVHSAGLGVTLLAGRTKRTALGFELEPHHLDLSVLSEEAGVSRGDLATTVALLGWAAGLAGDGADVCYDLSSLIAGESDPDAYLASLFEARVDAATLEGKVSATVAALTALAREVEGVSTFVDSARTAIAATDFTSPESLATGVGFYPADDALYDAVRDYGLAADEAGAHEAAGRALTAIVWSRPAASRRWFASITKSETRRRVGRAVVAALEVDRSGWSRESTWRVRAMKLAGKALDDKSVDLAMRLVRAAGDIDLPDEPDAFSVDHQALLKLLRGRLEATYGLDFPGLDLEDARFLLDAARNRDGNDVVHLARILADALVGAVYESSIADETDRETFFDVRVVPGLTYLEKDPLPDGRTRRVARDRSDDTGPGMAVAVAFLVGLALLIAGIGWFVVTRFNA